MMSHFKLLIVILAMSQANAFNCTKSGRCKREIEDFRLQEIKNLIEGQLPMRTDTPVNYTDAVRAMWNRQLEKMIDDDHTRGEETETSFISARDPSSGEDPSLMIATFDVTDNLNTQELLEAVLIFKVQMPEHLRNSVQDVFVQVYEKNEDRSLGEMVVSAKYAVEGDEKIEIRLPVATVKGWYTDSPIGGIFVSALLNESGQNLALHPQQTKKDTVDNMLLQLTTRLEGGRRSRRHASPICSDSNPSEGCCLYDFVVDFHKIGWDWIVAPPRYNAYMCRGNCKLNSHHYSLTESGHSKIMRSASRAAETAKHLEGVGFCCHPTDYEFIKLIYVNRDGKVSVANVNGMVARRCGCT